MTSKPEIILLNLDDSQSDHAKIPRWTELKKKADEQGVKLCTLYGSLEMDIADLDEDEAAAFTEGLDITEPGREKLIEEAYRILGLISFFTCGPDEVRAWTLNEGDNAVDAADKLLHRLFPVGDVVNDASQPTRDSNEFNVCHVFSYTSMSGSMLTSST